jgi:hypothetical protein
LTSSGRDKEKIDGRRGGGRGEGRGKGRWFIET